jgi:hypothetical protein
MKIKLFLFLIVIAALGTFIYLKLQILGDPASNFNQTTRFSLGKHPIFRSILGLGSAGDARAEYFSGQGPIIIEWFAPPGADIDEPTLQKFADLAALYTGRETKLFQGGPVDDSTIQLANLSSLKLQQFNQKITGQSLLQIIFAEDYAPRPNNELATTYKESGMVLSLSAHRQFLQNSLSQMNDYLLTSMLHEFGHQLGLEHNTDADCVMDANAGIDSGPATMYARSTPVDFCEQEKTQISNLKLQFQ